MKKLIQFLTASFIVGLPSMLLAQSADLEVSSVNLNTTVLAPGDSVTATVAWANLSPDTGTGAGFDVLVELVDPNGNVDDSEIIASGALGAEEAAVGVSTLTIPLDNPNGTYTVRVTVDSAGAIAEENESNNIDESASFTIDRKSDLEIIDFSYEPGEWEADDYNAFSITFHNRAAHTDGRGTLRVEATDDEAYYLEVVLSSDNVFGNSDDFLLYRRLFYGDAGIGSLANPSLNLLPGDEITINWFQMIPRNFAGDYFVLAKIDTEENVDEYIEEVLTDNGNNVFYSNESDKITIRPSSGSDPITFRASEKVDGAEATTSGVSEQPDMSEDGRYTVFSSLSQLVDEDTDDYYDIYLKDNFTLSITLLSDSLEGSSGSDGDSRYPAISANGDKVVFESDASNLVLADTNDHTDIFMIDLDTFVTTRVNLSSTSEQGNGGSFSADVSSDGQYVVFASKATNLVAGGTTEGRSHVYVRDTVNDTTTLVSLAGGGAEAGGNSYDPVIAANGTHVVFTSEADDIIAAYTGSQIFRVEIDGASPVLVSQVGGVVGNARSYSPSVSEDGAIVAFVTDATNLDDGGTPDTNGIPDITIRDITNTSTDRIHASNGDLLNTPSSETSGDLGALEPSISSDGRYVVFRTQSDNLLPLSLTRWDESNLALSAIGPTGYNPAGDIVVLGYSDLNNSNIAGSLAVTDIYLFDRNNPTSLELISRNSFGFNVPSTIDSLGANVPSSENPAISGNGRFVAFASNGRGESSFVFGRTNRIANDTNDVRDVFVHDRRTTGSFSLGNAPTTALTSPDTTDTTPADGRADNELFPNETVRIQASAIDSDGIISTVTFSSNGDDLGSPTLDTDSGEYYVDYEFPAVGIYEITVSVTDNDGNSSSDSLIYIVSNGVPPSVSLTAPDPTDGDADLVADEFLQRNTSYELRATATDLDGLVTSVEFFVEGVSIGLGTVDDTQGNFAISWTPELSGLTDVEVVATDELGNTASASATYNVVSGTAPVVGLTAVDVNLDGVADDSLTVGEVVTLEVSATDVDGTVVSVEYTVNGTSIGFGTLDNVSGNFNFAWTPTTLGLFEVQVVGTDNDGNESADVLIFTVVTGVAPTVSLDADGDNDGSADASVTLFDTVTISATASDLDGIIETVSYTVNGVSLGFGEINLVSGTYDINWTPQFLGTNTVVVTVVDNAGNPSSDTANFTVVAGSVPVVNLTAPDIADTTPADGIADNTLLLSGTYDVSATATDGDGQIVSVEFFADGVLLGEGSLSGVDTYSVEWTPATTGFFTLQVRATDNLGNQTSESLIYVVNNGVAPVISFESPDPTDGDNNGIADNNLTRGESYLVEIEVEDVDGNVVSVSASVNGGAFAQISPGALLNAYEFSFTPIQSELYQIEILAVDDLGNESVEILSYNVVDGAAPVVSIVSPPDGNSFLPGTVLPIQAIATDSDGVISRVEFYVNGVFSQLANESYRADLRFPATDSYTVTALAVDNLGNQTLSAPITVEIENLDTVTPRIYLDHPLPLGGGDSINDVSVASSMYINANVVDPDGSAITDVNFYINGELIGSATSNIGDDYGIFFDPNAPGDYSLWAEAIDEDGNSAISIPIALTVGELQAPMPDVSIRQPFPIVGVNQEVEVFVDAGDDLLPVDRVDLYADGILVASSIERSDDNSFALTWTPTIAGGYDLTARAVQIDPNGQTFDNWAISTSVGLTVTPPYASTPPSVAIRYPLGGDIITTASNILVQAGAEDTDGTISQVDFYVDNDLVGSDTTAPYSVEWTPGTTGSKTLIAVATDNTGDSNLSESVIVIVEPSAGSVPAVSIISPPDGNSFLPGTVLPIQAVAFDSDGIITQIEFFVNGVFSQLADENFRASISFPSTGSYSVIALATDNSGNKTFSAPVTIEIENLDTVTPRIYMNHPLPLGGGDSINDVSVASSMYINANVVDPDGSAITDVNFYINGELIGAATSNIGDDYGIFFDPNAPGNYSLWAEAIDEDGNSAISIPIALTVGELQAPMPDVSIREPFPIVGVDQEVEVFVDAGDDLLPVDRVDLYADGIIVASSVERSDDNSFALTWTPTIAGNYGLTARAVQIDPNGQTFDNWAISTSVGLTVTPPYVSTPPSVAIQYPLGGDIVTTASNVLIQAGAADSDGTITQVAFYVDNDLIGTDTTAPYSVNWIPGTTGSHTLIAVATDNDGDNNLSESVIVLVEPSAGFPPNVAIVNPDPTDADLDEVADGIIQAGTENVIRVLASDPDGLVDTVTLYANGTEIGSAIKSSQPEIWEAIWIPQTTGIYTLVAVVKDTLGNQSANSVNYQVEVGLPPVISITDPLNLDAFTVLNPISIQADASDPVGFIQQVEFFVWGNSIGIDTSYPFTTEFSTASPGNYQLTAVATNNQGLTTTSDPVVITIGESQIVSVSINNPIDGTTIQQGIPLILTADAVTTSGGNVRMEFFANGSLIDTDNTYPYQGSWSPTSTGDFSIIVKATELETGDTATSEEVSVTVTSTAPPVVNFENPVGYTPSALSDVYVSVDATDADGSVQSVEFFVNGVSLGSPDQEAPFATFWRPGSVGDYTLTALAIDDSGNQVLAEQDVSVIPQAGLVPSVTVSLTASGNVAPGSRIIARANIFDDDTTDMEVTFFMNGTQVGDIDTEAPYSMVINPELGFANSYSISVVARDNDGNSRISTVSPLYIGDVTLDQPNIEIVNPSSGENLTVGSRAPIRVDLSGGAAQEVTELIFYADGVEIGRDETTPYSFDWLPERSGINELIVAAVQSGYVYDHDNDPNTDSIPVTPVTLSSPVSVNVNPSAGGFPSISFEVHPERENLAIGSRVMLYADAQDLDGTVDQVEFFQDGVSIGVDTAGPFNLVITTEEEGEFFLNALATDNAGNVVTSTFQSINVSSRVVTQTPEVLLSVPLSGQEGSLIRLRASTEGFVLPPESVDFYVNGVIVGSATERPYSLDWLASLNGDLSFFASAKLQLPDESLITTVSDVAVRIITENDAPVINSLTFSYPNQDPVNKPDPLVNETLSFSVDVSDSGPIQSIDLLRDGEVVSTLSDPKSPFEIDETPPGLGNYNYSVIVTDKGGLQAESAIVPVTVTVGEVPVVEITNPITDLTPPAGEDGIPEIASFGTQNLQATAFDTDGVITEVRFFVDGALVGTPDTSAPYSAEYTAPFVSVTTEVQITARAIDDSGNVAVSAAQTLRILPDNPPVINSFESERAGTADFSLRLNDTIRWFVDVEDDYSVSSIVLKRSNGVGEPESINIPFNTALDTPPIAAIYDYYLEVTDNAGNVTISESIQVTVAVGSRPLVAITSPFSGSDIGLGQNVAIEVDAEAVAESGGLPTGTIEKVEFFINNELLSTDTVAPYDSILNVPAEGNYRIQAVATMDTGIVGESSVVTVRAVDGNVPVIISFTNNTTNNTGLINIPIVFTVTATDDGGIRQVDLIQDGTIVGSTIDTPYEFNVNPSEIGNFNFYARVENTVGNFATSEDVNITVRQPDPEASNNDFVYQTFLDILYRTPTASEQSEFSNRIENSGLSRARLIEELMDINLDSGIDYNLVENIILVHTLLLDRIPSRQELEFAHSVSVDSGLDSFISTISEELEVRYVVEVNADNQIPTASEIVELPSVDTSINSEIEAFLKYVFKLKYGQILEGTNLSRLKTNFNAFGITGFLVRFLDDKDFIRSSSSIISSGMGLRFDVNNPPSDFYREEVRSVSLLVNLLRIIPTEAEVTDLGALPFIDQVNKVLEDARYARRFTSVFGNELEILESGWRFSDWFGNFNASSLPWYYHENLGWIYFDTVGQSATEFSFYSDSLGWVLTSESIYPVIYERSTGLWLVVQDDAYQAGLPLSLYNLSNDSFVTR